LIVLTVFCNRCFDRLISIASLSIIAFTVAGCGGGGGGSSAADTVPGPAPIAAAASTEPDAFLLFPNPQVQADGAKQTDTRAYADAYYAAIDPTNAKDTLAKWKAANNFDSGAGTQVTVVFGDKRDLGYGRRMTVRQNPDGTSAYLVENYLIQAGPAYTYSPLNLEAAIVRDQRWLLGYNTIEFSPGPNGGVSFAKFFNFNAKTGQRDVTVDLDGRGEKVMPGPCITCHGGRGDALTPPDATGKARFNLVSNGPSNTRGDVRAQLHPFEADAFDYSTSAGFSRAEQEAALKTINKIVLCSYPLAAPSTSPEDACRRPAQTGEWQGSAATVIKAAYGGDGLPNAVFADNFVPPSWEVAGQTTLYKNVYAPACRTCHLLRGTGLQSDIDLSTFDKFSAYSDRTKAHIVDRGNMPLAKIVYDAFYGSSSPETLATFLQDRGFTAKDSAGRALRPGRPLADAGPDRVVRQGATVLSASKSLFANGYQWSVISGPAGGAALSNATSVDATFNATVDGAYVVQLIASSGTTAGVPAQLRIVVDSQLPLAPANIRFADIKTVLQSASGGCTAAGCHAIASPTGAAAPLVFANIDRNGDGSVGDATDDAWLYAEVRSRINFTEVVASPLLRKPSGNHHNGAQRPGFNTSVAPGQSARASYDLFVNWIANGAPR
jgi:mono/diheme cytochrome c family protein